jgi:hypothetical protein
MNNEFDFLRKIFSCENPEFVMLAFKSLSNEGLEVYMAEGDSYKLITTEELIGDAQELYVPASDWAFAKELLTKANLTEYITEYIIPENVKSELVKAEEMYFKRRKMFYIETAAIIVLILIYVLIKSNIR